MTRARRLARRWGTCNGGGAKVAVRTSGAVSASRSGADQPGWMADQMGRRTMLRQSRLRLLRPSLGGGASLRLG